MASSLGTNGKVVAIGGWMAMFGRLSAYVASKFKKTHKKSFFGMLLIFSLIELNNRTLLKSYSFGFRTVLNLTILSVCYGGYRYWQKTKWKVSDISLLIFNSRSEWALFRPIFLKKNRWNSQLVWTYFRKSNPETSSILDRV